MSHEHIINELLQKENKEKMIKNSDQSELLNFLTCSNFKLFTHMHSITHITTKQN